MESTESILSTFSENENTRKLPDEILWRSENFITVRFGAVLGIVFLLLLSRFVLHISHINYTWLWILTGLLFIFNSAYAGIRYFRRNKLSEHFIQSFMGVQFLLDICFLSFFLHFSGGAANPLFLFYFLIIIPASALLPKRFLSYLVGFSAILFSTMTILEGTGHLTHYRLIPGTFFTLPLFFIAVPFVFTATIIVVAHLTFQIAEKMRRAQEQCMLSNAEKSRAEMEKMHFLDVVAHDLKSPLSAIESMVFSVLDAYGSEMNEDMKQTLEYIPKRTRDLIRFIQNLADFSNIRSQAEIREHFRPLNFLPVVTSTVEMYMDQALDKNITMTVQAEPNIPLILGSREHLERMVANLIANAIRYTPENGSITVKLGVQNGRVVLTVADSGIGIPEQNLPHIFDEFYRANNARKMSSAGTGLGLPISKFIVERHGGTITVNSVEGEGTLITVSLPAYRPDSPRKEE